MPNPLVDLGTLNRLRGSIIVPLFPELNVTASFLGEDGITMALEGDASTVIPAMTGTVPSPAPYMMVLITANLLKSNFLSELYKIQMEVTSLLGPLLIRTDSPTLTDYFIFNATIQSVGELRFTGKDNGYGVRIRGYYLVNALMWDS